MLNPVSAYAEAGQKAAQARNERDEGRAAHWADWYRRARDLEVGEAKQMANTAYRDAYTKARRI